MQDFSTMNLDAMMRDIVEIFNLDGVELVRLSGLLRRELKISNCMDLDKRTLDIAVHKMKLQGIINYRYVLVCPHCKEVTYQIAKRDSITSAKVCDTCKGIYIPTKDVSLYEYEKEMQERED